MQIVMKRLELPGITLLAIALISINAYNGQDNGRFGEDKSISSSGVTSGSLTETVNNITAGVKTSADWPGEAAYKLLDY